MTPNFSARQLTIMVTVVWLVLLTPPMRSWLESSMTLHMLVQLPLLFVIGFCWGWAWRRAPKQTLSACVLRMVVRVNRWGATGLIVAAFTLTLWMLPRLLDSARLDFSFDLAKFLTVSALAGVAISISWHATPAIVRAVVHLEVIATLLRFGWGYLATEERLCLVYLVGDQHRTGSALLLLAAIYALVVVWRPLFGGLRIKPCHDSQSTT